MNFDLDAKYDGIRFDASKAFPDAMSETIDTYNYEEAVPFETSYMAGFYADGGNVNKEEYTGIVNELVNRHLKNNGIKYGSINIKSSNLVEDDFKTKAKKVLFPVWLNTHKNGKRVSYSAINGQNGDVASEIPINKWKYIQFTIIGAALISILLNLFFTFKPATFLFITSIVLLIFGIYLRKIKCDVYVREHDLDDIGKIGIEEFNYNQDKTKKTSKTIWNFKIPGSVKFKAWWKTLIGLSLSITLLLTGIVLDYLYYGVAIINIALVIWTVFDLIHDQSLLSSREIKIFTMKRGGDNNG